MTAQRESEIRPSGLKPWIIATALLFPPISFFTNQLMITMGTWWIWPALLPFPVTFYILLFYGLSKVSTRFKLSPQELACFLTITWLIAGTTYTQNNVPYWTICPLPTYNFARYIHGLYNDPYKDAFWENVPPYMAPKNMEALKAFFEGGIYDPGVWATPILFWILFSIVLYCGSYIMLYTLRKPMIEMERLPFPTVLPSAYVFLWYAEEEKGKPKIFNFRLPLTKFFWIGLLIGISIYVPNAISALTPITFPTYLNVIPCDLVPYTMSFLPGAEMNSYYPLADAIAWSLIPLDVLATAVLYWVVFGIIYPVIGVKAGILPYVPGESEYGQYAWSVGPFKRGWFGFFGVVFGLGVWCLWYYRESFVTVFKSGLFPNKYPTLPKEDDGVSFRLVAWGTIAFLVALTMFFMLAGVSLLMSIVGVLLWIIVAVGWVRVSAYGFNSYAPNFHNNLRLYFDIGTLMGQWGPRPDPKAFNAMFMWANTGSGSRMASYNVHGQFGSYKIGNLLNTSGKDILIVSILTMLSTAITVQSLWPWWYTRFGGYNKLGTVEYHVWDIGGVWSLTHGTPPTDLTAPETLAYAVGGTIFVFVTYFLRLRYPWFFINPVGLQLGAPAWWAIPLTALVIKALTLKLGGTKAWENYVMPFAIGVALGNGVIYIISAFIALPSRVLPTLMARL